MTDTKPPPRTPGLAVAEAEELLAGGLRSESVMEGGVVVSDPRDVNHDGKTVADQFRELEARSMVEKNAPLEQEALQKLTPEQRAQYENVRSSVEDADDPMALLSLQKMLLKGELPGEQAIGGDQDVLDGLSQLVTQPLAPGIDRSQLLTDAVQEMATPAAVSQHQKGTCAASSVVIALLRENPAEYLRLVSGLSSPEGTVALANGDTLRREPGMEGDDGSGRSVPHRLLAPAMMEYGDPKRNYINSWDRRVGGVGDIQGGLDADSVQRLLGGVFGREFDMLYDPQTQRVGDSDWVTTLGRLAEGEPVVATLVWGGGAHMVTVVGVKETNGERFVEVINPWGQTERVPEAEFRENLVWVNVPERREPAPGGGGGGSW